MSKRTIEHPAGPSTVLQSPSPVKACKRPRTEQFLEKAARYETDMRTCRLFQAELELLYNSTHTDETASGPLNGNNESKDEGGLLKLQESLRTQVYQYDKRYRSYCETLKAEADESVRLADSFRCLSNAIGSDSPSILSVMSQGLETTEHMKDSIARFAGVPSEADLADFKEVRSLLQ
jgi:hypothetical protein